MRLARVLVLLGILVPAVLTMTACRTVYTGWDSDIDGVLWRQIAVHEDYLWRSLGHPQGIDTYLEDTGGVVWDGKSDAAGLDISEGAVVFYDVERIGNRFDFGVFISSGPRPDRPTDAGDVYTGPSQVFTCFEVVARFAGDRSVDAERDTDVQCPEALVDQMPSDAAFATDDVFDG